MHFLSDNNFDQFCVMALPRWFSILLFLYIISTIFSKNNSCRSYWAYLNILFSSDCYYSPDADDDGPTIIRRHIGLFEQHHAETEDGYILTLFRLPKENHKGVVFLDNPMANDATIYLAQYNESIAFTFWRAGYEVWLNNNRGTFYSMKHKTLSSQLPQFWNYSLDELGYYDSSASIQYIRRTTNESKLIYVGVSLGGTKALIYASERSDEAAKFLKIIVPIAPGTQFTTSTTIIKYVLPPFFKLQNWLNFIITLYTPFTGKNAWYFEILRAFVRIFPFKEIVKYVLAPLFGWTNELDPNLVNMLVGKFGSEFSFKAYKHIIQFYDFNRFQKYDFGVDGNLLMYGNASAPLYSIQDIKIPVLLAYGENDNVVTAEDATTFYESLPQKSKVFKPIAVEGFNHLDFMFGKGRNEKLYNKIIRILDDLKEDASYIKKINFKIDNNGNRGS